MATQDEKIDLTNDDAPPKKLKPSSGLKRQIEADTRAQRPDLTETLAQKRVRLGAEFATTIGVLWNNCDYEEAYDDLRECIAQFNEMAQIALAATGETLGVDPLVPGFEREDVETDEE